MSVKIRDIKPSKRRELKQILDINEGWKRLGKCRGWNV